MQRKASHAGEDVMIPTKIISIFKDEQICEHDDIGTNFSHVSGLYIMNENNSKRARGSANLSTIMRLYNREPEGCMERKAYVATLSSGVCA